MAPLERVPDLPPYPLPDEVRSAIRDLSVRSDILFIGEGHGTHEVPLVVAAIAGDIQPFGYRALALEMPLPMLQPLLAWADGETDRIPPFFDPPSMDGRGSLEILGLVRAVRRSGWDVWCFDAKPEQWQGTWADRDRGYAESFAEQCAHLPSGTKVIGLCGGLHARLRHEPDVTSALWPSCAANLVEMLPTTRIHSVKLTFHGGSFFNAGRVGKQPPRPWPWGDVAAVVTPSEEGCTLDLHVRVCTPATLVGGTGPRFQRLFLRAARFAPDAPGAERPIVLISLTLAWDGGPGNIRAYLTPRRRIAMVDHGATPAVIRMFPSLQEAAQAVGEDGTPRFDPGLLERAARALSEIDGQEIVPPPASPAGEGVEYIEG